METLKARILAAPGGIEPETSHHVFRSGRHGRKCDIDLIPEDSELFWDIAEQSARAIENSERGLPDMLITVANGANRFARPFRYFLGSAVSVRTTIKNPENKTDIRLNERTVKAIQRTYPSRVLIFDDLGTEGTNSAYVARQVIEAGTKNVRVFNALYRRDTLERLDELDIAYTGLIRLTDDLPSPTKTECEESFYCAKRVKLIPYGQ